MKRLLITGFEPFDCHGINPSWAAVSLLPDTVGNCRIQKCKIPTVYTSAAALVLEQAEILQPHCILCVGLAAGRDAVTPERIAVNIRDARIPDNSGILCSGQKINPNGPAAYFSTLPVERMAQAIRDRGIPATVSNTAGTYVCNDVLYTLLHRFQGTDTQVGFVHVPYIPEQGTPNLPLEKIIAALEAAISVL